MQLSKSKIKAWVLVEGQCWGHYQGLRHHGPYLVKAPLERAELGANGAGQEVLGIGLHILPPVVRCHRLAAAGLA